MISDILDNIRRELPDRVRLVAVSKYHPAQSILEAYNAGQRIFGENHVQELQQKHDVLPTDIEWHFIGHLQTNKVKYIAPYVSMIHSIDTAKLLAEVNKQALKNNRRIKVLLQLHVAKEETKFGFTTSECMSFLNEGLWRNMDGIEICGIMCMASHVDDKERIAADFETAHNFFLEAKQHNFNDIDSFRECSWGMSDDYKIAIEYGSTLVRIGSKIFGERDYTK